MHLTQTRNTTIMALVKAWHRGLVTSKDLTLTPRGGGLHATHVCAATSSSTRRAHAAVSCQASRCEWRWPFSTAQEEQPSRPICIEVEHGSARQRQASSPGKSSCVAWRAPRLYGDIAMPTPMRSGHASTSTIAPKPSTVVGLGLLCPGLRTSLGRGFHYPQWSSRECQWCEPVITQ